MRKSTWLHVYDPKALHSIAIKDQDIWSKNSTSFKYVLVHLFIMNIHIIMYACSTLLLGPGLLTTESAQHRKQRKMLTPVFSVAYLRNVTPLFYEVAHKVRVYRATSVGRMLTAWIAP